MGRSEPNRASRKGDPPRSERKWWKADYDGSWFPNYYDNPTLAAHVQKCRVAQTKRRQAVKQ